MRLTSLLRRLHSVPPSILSIAPTDREALRAFIAHRDEAAFAALVNRHGPMVLSVCRRVLHHAQDAEDACQATFLVLARKATSIGRSDALASWLHGVAYRIALRARRDAGRRRAREQQAPCRSVRIRPRRLRGATCRFSWSTRSLGSPNDTVRPSCFAISKVAVESRRPPSLASKRTLFRAGWLAPATACVLGSVGAVFTCRRCWLRRHSRAGRCFQPTCTVQRFGRRRSSRPGYP